MLPTMNLKARWLVWENHKVKRETRHWVRINEVNAYALFNQLTEQTSQRYRCKEEEEMSRKEESGTDTRLVWKEGISTIHLIYELQTHWQRGRDGSLWHRAEAERGRGFSNVKVDRRQRQCVQNMRVPPNSVFATLTAEQVNTWH